MRVKDWAENLGHKQTKFRRVLGYGDLGTGKTLFGGTFPDPFIIDTDRGLITLDTMGVLPPDNRIIELQKTDSIFKIVKDILFKLRDGKPPFDKNPPKTLIIDSFTGLADFYLYEAMTAPDSNEVNIKRPEYEKAEYSHWALLKNRCQATWEILKDLPMHVYVTAGVKVEKDETTGKFVGGPNVQGGARDIIGHAFDEVYFFQPVGSGEKIRYTIFTKTYDFYHAKSRLDLPAKLETPTFDKLYKNVEKVSTQKS